MINKHIPILMFMFLLMGTNTYSNAYTLDHCKTYGGDHNCVDRIPGIGAYLPFLQTYCFGIYPIKEAHSNSVNIKVLPFNPNDPAGSAPEGWIWMGGCGTEFGGHVGGFMQAYVACPAGHSPVYETPNSPSTAIITCVEREYQCACNERKVEGHCTPMDKQLTIATRANGTYVWQYGNNYHEVPRCPPIFIPESNGASCSADNSTKVGNPIDCATGQKVQTELDYKGTGIDPIVYSRYYESTAIEKADEHTLDSALGSHTHWKPKSAPTASAISDRYGAVVKVLRNNSGLSRVIYKRTNDKTWRWNTRFGPINYTESTNTSSFSLESGKTFIFNENEDSQVEEVIEEDNQIQRYTYHYSTISGEKVLTKIANRFGRFLEFLYDTDGKLTSIVDQDGLQIFYNYDSYENLTSVIYPDQTPLDLTDNPTRLYLYENENFPNHLTGVIDQHGERFATYTYDSEGRAVSTQHSQGINRTVVSYPEDGQAIIQYYLNHESYREEHVTYDMFRGSYRLTSREIVKCNDCEKGIELWEYDSSGYKTRHVDFDGVVTKWTYNSAKKLNYEYKAFGVAGEQQTTQYTWDVNHPNKVKTIKTETEITTYEYDQHGNLTSTQVTER